MTTKLREFDPILVQAVESALEPYIGKLPPEMIEHFRDEALVLMSVHPYPAALVEALRASPTKKAAAAGARAPEAASGTVTRDRAGASAPEAESGILTRDGVAVPAPEAESGILTRGGVAAPAPEAESGAMTRDGVAAPGEPGRSSRGKDRRGGGR